MSGQRMAFPSRSQAEISDNMNPDRTGSTAGHSGLNLSCLYVLNGLGHRPSLTPTDLLEGIPKLRLKTNTCPSDRRIHIAIDEPTFTHRTSPLLPVCVTLNASHEESLSDGRALPEKLGYNYPPEDRPRGHLFPGCTQLERKGVQARSELIR